MKISSKIWLTSLDRGFSQNTLSFLVERIFDFKVDRCPKF